MARVMVYHRTEFPMGKVFDTESNKKDPHLSTAPFGWVDSPDKLHLTQDDLIAAIVKNELKAQSSDRAELDREFEKKTGDTAHFAAKEETLIKTLDTPGIQPKRGPGRPKKGT